MCRGRSSGGFVPEVDDVDATLAAKQWAVH
jgi:hypothetical protein